MGEATCVNAFNVDRRWNVLYSDRGGPRDELKSGETEKKIVVFKDILINIFVYVCV